jgi:hypothetical protein
MTTKKKVVVAVPKETTREIKGELVFQRTGQGMVTFRTVSPNILSNPLVQIPIDVLPADYDLALYSITGTFVYKIVVRKK